MPNKNLDEALATTLSMLLETDEADLATSQLLSIGINLVNLGADVNTIDSSGFRLFHHDVLSQSISASQSLIDLGADVNLQLETEINQHKNLDEALATTLSMLLETDEADLATSKLLSIGINLVNLGADVNTIDSYGFSLFHHAVLSQSISASQSLIDLGADVNLQLETEINQQLLAEGKALLATIHQTSYSPLHLLATNNIDNIELITLLINNNANLNSMGLSGMNVVQAYYNHYDHHISVLELLIQHSDVNFRNLDGRTILHYVNEIELITMILDRGADVNAVDNYGRTALYYHSIGFDNHQAQINLLIQSGADLNIIDEDGHTPLRDDLNVLDPFEIINSINQIIPDVIIFMGVGILLNMEHNFADNFCG